MWVAWAKHRGRITTRARLSLSNWEASVVLLLVLALGNAWTLTVGEYLRVGLLMLGCGAGLYMHAREIGRAQRDPTQGLAVSGGAASVVLGFLMAFCITQFDPLLSSDKTQLLGPFWRLWFLVASSLTVLWLAVAVHMTCRARDVAMHTEKRRIADFAVLTTLLFVSGAYLATRYLFSKQVEFAPLLKVCAYGAIWFSFVRIHRLSTEGHATDTGGRGDPQSVLQRLGRIGLLVLLAIVVVGSVRVVYGRYLARDAEQERHSGNRNGANRSYERWYSTNQFLGDWSAEDLTNYGSLLLSAGDGDGGEILRGQIAGMGHSVDSQHRLLGDMYVGAMQLDRAIMEYQQISDSFDEAVETRKRLARCLAAQKYTRRLLALLRRSPDAIFVPGTCDEAITLGTAQIHIRRDEDAVEVLNLAGDLCGGSASVLYWLARALIISGHPQTALPLFSRISDARWDHGDIPFWRGVAEVAVGNLERASESFLLSEKLVSSHQAAREGLELIESGERNYERFLPGSLSQGTADFGDVELVSLALEEGSPDRGITVVLRWRLTETIGASSERFQVFLRRESTGELVVNEAPYFDPPPSRWTPGAVVEQRYSTRAAVAGDRYELVLFVMRQSEPVDATSHSWLGSEVMRFDVDELSIRGGAVEAPSPAARTAK
jgi:hypothetical protein